MTIDELKEELLIEHKRDKRLTLLGFFLIGIVILIVCFLIKIYAMEQAMAFFNNLMSGGNVASSGYEDYYKLIIPLVFAVYLIIPFYKLYALSKRPAKIDLFINKLREGLIAQSINQSTVHKIIIPLIKINIKLSPVEFVHIYLADDYDVGYNFKGYKFPFPRHISNDLKSLLSGANMNQLNQSWYELYGENSVSAGTENIPLKSVEEFETFVDTDLKSDLAEVETDRKKSKKNYILYGLFVAVIMGGWFALQYLVSTGKLTLSPPALIGGFIGLFAVFYIVFYFVKVKGTTQGPMGNSLNHSFKTKVFNRIIHFINPSFQYIMHGHVSQEEFLATGLFQNKYYDISGNDQVIGNHNGVAFQFCDLTVHRTKKISNEKEAPDTAFFGQMFIAQFNKKFTAELYLIPKKTGGILKGNDIKNHLSFGLGDKVTLEDPEFMKMFTVYSNDQIEARYIMSTALMHRIKEFIIKTKGQYFISFKGNRISVANNSQKNNFETKMFKATDKKLMVSFYNELCNQLSIIDDLKLNIKIWK